MKKVSFPNVDFFNSSSKKDSPYDKLYQHLAKQLGTTLEEMSKNGFTVSDVYLTEKDAKVLDELVKNWIEKAHKLSGKELEKNFGYYHLDFSPATLSSDSYESGYIYFFG